MVLALPVDEDDLPDTHLSGPFLKPFTEVRNSGISRQGFVVRNQHYATQVDEWLEVTKGKDDAEQFYFSGAVSALRWGEEMGKVPN